MPKDRSHGPDGAVDVALDLALGGPATDGRLENEDFAAFLAAICPPEARPRRLRPVFGSVICVVHLSCSRRISGSCIFLCAFIILPGIPGLRLLVPGLAGNRLPYRVTYHFHIN